MARRRMSSSGRAGITLAVAAVAAAAGSVAATAGAVTTARGAEPDDPPGASVVVPADEGGRATLHVVIAEDADAAATVDWGTGEPPESFTRAELARGVDHVYGDDGTYSVAVASAGGGGAVAVEVVPLKISNVAPSLELVLDGAVAFPGGTFAVVAEGEEVGARADAADPGSDDLTFTWSSDAATTVMHDRRSPDPPLSSDGADPAAASDAARVRFDDPGVSFVGVAAADDDGGTTTATAGVLVIPRAAAELDRGEWTRLLSTRTPATAPASAALGVVAAMSGVFGERHPAGSPDQAAAVLERAASPADRAIAELLLAWLQVAGGAVPWDAPVIATDDTASTALDVLSAAERVLRSPATDAGDLERLAGVLRGISHSDS